MNERSHMTTFMWLLKLRSLAVMTPRFGCLSCHLKVYSSSLDYLLLVSKDNYFSFYCIYLEEVRDIQFMI